METFVNHLYSNFGYVGILIAMAIESCCIPLPSEIIMPLAGFMTVAAAGHQAKFNLFGVTVVGALGCLVGSIIAYWIGYSGGRDLMLRYGKYVLISRRDAERADAFFAKRGDITVFVSRLLPVVRTFISLPAGMMRMRFGHFVVLTFLGSLPWCLLLAYIGQQLGVHWHDVGTWIHRFDVLIILVVVVLAALYVWRHIHGNRTAEAV
ncbi:MAG TPA: DedA family protein [Chloroflexota bacterium]